MDEQTAKRFVETWEEIGRISLLLKKQIEDSNMLRAKVLAIKAMCTELSSEVEKIEGDTRMLRAEMEARDALCEGFCKKIKKVELKAVKEG